MAITRTTMIDDDGSGTTGTILNNAWLQTIYGQIDTMFPAATFTFSDASGAGLIFTYAATGWLRVNNFLFVQGMVQYPVTANGAAAKLSGLPVAVADGAGHGGLFQGYGGVQVRMWVPIGATEVNFIHPATGAPLPNSALSGVSISVHGSYRV